MNKSSRRRSSSGGLRLSRMSIGGRKASRGSTSKNLKDVPSYDKIHPVLEHGKDVTPKCLYSGGHHENADQMNLEDSNASLDFRSLASMLQTGGMIGGTGIFGKSVLGSGIRNSIRSMSIASQSALYAPDDEEELNTMLKNSESSLESYGYEPTQQPSQILTEEELELPADITLSETYTETIFKIISTAVCEEIENLEEIKELNDAYDELCAGRLGNDKYTQRAMQTFNNQFKHKESATNPLGMIDVGSEVSTSILWDAFNLPVDDIAKSSSNFSLMNSNELEKSLSETIASSGEPKSNAGDTMSSEHQTIPQREIFMSDENDEERKNKDIENSPEMAAALVLVERVLSQNIYQNSMSAFRDLTQLDQFGRVLPKESNIEPRLCWLWSFSASVCKGYTVTSFAFNKTNPDIIAVCYGFNTKHKLSDATADKSGLVCIWNIKNLEFPERIFYLPSTATSCDFSLANPNLLAVGLFTGTVVIFNVTRKRKGFLKIWSHEQV